MADKKDYNVIDSAVVEIAFKVNQIDLLSQVKDAISQVQTHLNKNPLKLNVDSSPAGKTADGGMSPTKQFGESHSLQFSIFGEANQDLVEAVREYGSSMVEARMITAERAEAERKFRYEKLQFDKEKFEFQKQKWGESVSMGQFSSVEGIVGLLGGKALIAGLVATGVVTLVIKKTVDEILARSTEISNKFITGSTAFVDKTTRDTMARFGLDPMSAQGLDRSMGLLGISPQDMTLLTPGQQQAMGQLMQQWFDGIASIGHSDIQAFSDATQEFQLMMAQFRMQWQLTKMEILVHNRANIASMTESLGNLFETLIDFASSPIVRDGVGLMISFITGIIDATDMLISALNRAGRWFSWIPGVGGGGSTTNTTINNTNNNISVTGGIEDAVGSIRN